MRHFSSSENVAGRSVLIFREEGLVAAQNKQCAIYIFATTNTVDDDDVDDSHDNGTGNGTSDSAFTMSLYVRLRFVTTPNLMIRQHES